MPTPTGSALMERLVSLCRRRGFIFQSSEIYGGINGFWDYGPLGVELKNNMRDAWWDDMVGIRRRGPTARESTWSASMHRSSATRRCGWRAATSAASAIRCRPAGSARNSSAPTTSWDMLRESEWVKALRAEQGSLPDVHAATPDVSAGPSARGRSSRRGSRSCATRTAIAAHRRGRRSVGPRSPLTA